MSKKKMLINVTQAEESRVAIVSGGILEWIEIETGSREKLKGNIYKGVVESVNSALQAAFVKFGGGRAGFLPLDEINFKLLPARKRGKEKNGGKEKGKEKKGDRRGRGGGRARIQDLLQPGQELLVQVIREQLGTKPPTLSNFFSLPGRFLVLLPGSDSAGISRKIEDDAGRDRLKKILRGLDPPEGLGVIVRTAGLDQTKAELTRDMRYLTRLWQQIEKVSAKAKAPALIYQERDLVLRAIRDLFTPDIDEVFIDNEETYKRALKYFKSIMPSKQKLLTYYDGDQPLFSQYNLEDQIENIYKRRVPLKSGGAIVIDETEALTSIDVNSGKTREANIEETAYKTNLEAASEIARQLRLRDIGGLVVIDFIDLRTRSYIREVEKRLKEAMRLDKARHDMTRISKLGLLEMSRQRMRPTTASATYETCLECEGTGVVKTVESAALALLRRIHTRAARGDLARIKVLLPHGVAHYLLNRKRDEILRLEQRYQTEIHIVGRMDIRASDLQFETETRATARREEREGRREQEPRVTPPEAGEVEAAGEEEKPADEKRRRRSRRRRRGGEDRRPEDHKGTEAAPADGPEIDEDPSGEEAPADAAGKPAGRRRRSRGGRGRRGRGRRRDEPRAAGEAEGAGEAEAAGGAPDLSGPPDFVSGPDDDPWTGSDESSAGAGGAGKAAAGGRAS